MNIIDKPIRTIKENDMLIASNCARYGIHHKQLTPTANGYNDDRFEEFSIHYQKHEKGWYFFLKDYESNNSWNNTERIPVSLKSCAVFIGRIIEGRYK